MSLRVVAQAVDRASLLVDNVARYVDIEAGVLLYVAFLAGCTEDVVRNAVATIVSSKVFLLGVDRCADEEAKAQGGSRAKPSALVDSTSDSVLVVPQATLAGKLKGKVMQYHQQIDKAEGARLYRLFCFELAAALLPQVAKTAVDEHAADAFANGFTRDAAASNQRQVLWGTYGNRQGLKIDSPGPFTHTFEF